MRVSDPHTIAFLPRIKRRRSQPTWVLFAALVAPGLMAGQSSGQCPNPKVTGCWTHHNDAGANWAHTQIHMALLPGDGVNEHSLILSWENNVARGLHGWNPGAPNCTSYRRHCPTRGRTSSAPATGPWPTAGSS